MADLALLQQDALTAARLLDALHPTHEVEVCDSWARLEHDLARREVDVCVVDADYPTREEAMIRLATLQHRHPTTAMVAFGNFEGQEQTVYRLGMLGVDGVVAARHGDEHGHVRDAVDQALLAARARQAADLLDGRVGQVGRRAVAWSVEHARDRPSVDALAGALGTTPAALANTLQKEGLPTPNRLLVWGRLLLAAAILERDDRTVEETAYQVGYAGANGLTRAMRREVGRTPGEISDGGGMADVHRSLFPPRRRSLGRGGLRLLALAGLLLAPGSCAGPGSALPTPPTPAMAVDRLLERPPLDGLHLGVLAVEAETGRTVVSHNAGRRFVPASNEKILTTAAALELLGPGYRWRTALWSDAPLRAGALEGDLVLLGTGDPTLSSRYWPSAQAALEALADSLVAAGVTRVEGGLVVDVSAWDSTGVPGSWEVGDLPFAYAAGAGAFAVAEGEIRAVVRGGGSAGAPAVLEGWWPAADTTFLQADLRTGPADSTTRVRAHHLPERGALVLRGRVRAGSVDTVRLAAREPVGQAASLLRRSLEARGVAVAGPTTLRWRREDAGCAVSPDRCPGARVLAGLVSPPLTEVARGILEPSQNWMAEQLLRTLGAEAGDPARSRVRGDRNAERGGAPPGSRESALEVLSAWLEGDVGLAPLEAVPEDGSGLSTRNLVTPRALVAVLDRVRRSDHAEAYRAALAAPGEEDSTLERRLLDLRGRLVAKTGSISNVDALSGYLWREDGTEVIFSILSNGSGLPAATVREAMDAVVRTLAEG